MDLRCSTDRCPSSIFFGPSSVGPWTCADCNVAPEGRNLKWVMLHNGRVYRGTSFPHLLTQAARSRALDFDYESNYHEVTTSAGDTLIFRERHRAHVMAYLGEVAENAARFKQAQSKRSASADGCHRCRGQQFRSTLIRGGEMIRLDCENCGATQRFV